MNGTIEIIVKHGETIVYREYPLGPAEAERRFAFLCRERTDGYGVVIYMDHNVIQAWYRLDRDWPDDARLEADSPLFPRIP